MSGVNLPNGDMVSTGDVIIVVDGNDESAYEVLSVGNSITIAPNGWGGPFDDETFANGDRFREFLEDHDEVRVR